MRTILLAGLGAFVATGCATTAPSDAMHARAYSQECKVTYVRSGAAAIRNSVRGPGPSDDIARAEARMGIGRAKLNEPPELRPQQPEPGHLDDALRDC
ncbi:MAG: hypothetical protein ABI920_04900 [Casimicrobiaceae bacterium]